MQKTREKNLVLLIVLLTVVLTLLSGCGGTKMPNIEIIASDACISCHLQAEVIDSLYTPPEAAAGGGG